MIFTTVAVPGLSRSELQNSFGASMQVNAGLLIAVFVVASFAVPRLPNPPKERYIFLFGMDAVLFFLGLLSAAYGFMLAASGAFAQEAIATIMITWWLGVAMLLDGIGVSRFAPA